MKQYEFEWQKHACNRFYFELISTSPIWFEIQKGVTSFGESKLIVCFTKIIAEKSNVTKRYCHVSFVRKINQMSENEY